MNRTIPPQPGSSALALIIINYVNDARDHHVDEQMINEGVLGLLTTFRKVGYIGPWVLREWCPWIEYEERGEAYS